MRAVTRLFGLVAVGALIAGTAQAQTCLGFSSLANGGMNITPAVHFADHETSYGAQLNMGHLGMNQSHIISLFAQENTSDVTGVDNTTTFGGALGLQMKNSMGWEWCPQIGVDYTTTAKVLGLDGVVGLGKAFSSMGGFTPVPYIWGGIGFIKPDCDGCDSDTHAVYGAGLGFRLGGGQQITPSFSKTSMDGDKAVFHVAVSFPFGKKM